MLPLQASPQLTFLEDRVPDPVLQMLHRIKSAEKNQFSRKILTKESFMKLYSLD